MNHLSLFLFFLFFIKSQLSFSQEAQISQPDLGELIEMADENLYDNPSLSLQYAIDADSIAQKLQNDSIRATTLNRIGTAHWSLGNQLAALESIQASLQLSENRNIPSVVSRNFSTIGRIYRTSGFPLDATGYFRAALSIQQEIGDNSRMLTVNNDLGRAFLDVSFYDSAKLYFDQAMEYLEDQNKDIHFFLLYNIAQNEFSEGNIKEAWVTLEKALENALLNKSKSGIIRGNRLKAEFLRGQGESRKALEFALKATAIANNSKIKELIYRCNKTVSDCYGDLGIYEEAYKTNQAFETYRDSVFNNTVKNELQLLAYYQRMFNYKVIESESLQNKDLAERRSKTIFLLAFFIIFILGLLFVIFIVVRMLYRQKKELEELNDFKSKILAIVSHDLKYPMQEVVGVVNLFNEKLVSKQEISEVLPEIKQKTENLIELITNLLQWAEGQMDSSQLKRTEFSFLHLLEEIKTELQGRLDNKQIDLKLPEDDITLRTNLAILKIVLRNIVTNAIKFSFEKAEIRIFYKAGDYSLKIMIEDHGVGMNAEVADQLFKGRVDSLSGTSGETGSGVGLAICYDFIQRLGGLMSVESEQGKGTTFTIEVPK